MLHITKDMKTTSTFFRTTVVIAALICLLVSQAFATGDSPIPGIDVVVRWKPGGTAITTTNKSGKATSRKLTPGSYAVSMSVRLTSKIIQQLAQPATEGTPATPGSPAIPGTPEKTSEVAVKVTANGRVIEAKHILVTSSTKPGLVDIRTKSGKKLVIKIKKNGSKNIVMDVQGALSDNSNTR